MKSTALEFTTDEQNCLARLTEIMSSIHYAVNVKGEYPQQENFNERLIDLAERFPNTNWGNLYDRFHRQGKNR
mgnify:CR=1 FL=1